MHFAVLRWILEINGAYLNKAYYIATILQYSRELGDDGFETETKKVFPFGSGSYVVDLFAYKEADKRAYSFRLPPAPGEDLPAEYEDFEQACQENGLTPFVVDIKVPVERQIVFEDLETIINDYFLTGDLLPELAALPCQAKLDAVHLNDILGITIESEQMFINAKAALYASFGVSGNLDDQDCLSCESFPLSFTATLDGNHNCMALEYELDLSSFKAKELICQKIEEERVFVSKAKYDSLVSLYQELSESFLTMVESCLALCPNHTGENYFDEDYSDTYFETLLKEAKENRAAAGKAMRRNAPFVPQKLFEILDAVSVKCGQQLYRAEMYLTKGEKPTPSEAETCAGRAEDILKLRDEFTAYMRSYLQSIDIG